MFARTDSELKTRLLQLDETVRFTLNNSMIETKNRIFIMRHGQSMANIANLVVSDASNGMDNYGLSEVGVEQVLSSINTTTELDAATLIFSSDFMRAEQTAELVRKTLDAKSVTTSKALRERYFGEYELGPDNIYEEVWKRDSEDPDQTVSGVESVNSVLKRATNFVETLNQQHTNKTILLVAHGDILQILLTTFAGKDGSQHRSIPHLDTAEIRQLC